MTEEISAFGGTRASHEIRLSDHVQVNATASDPLEGLLAPRYLVVPVGTESLSVNLRVGDVQSETTLSGPGYYVVDVDGTATLTAAEDVTRLPSDPMPDAGIAMGSDAETPIEPEEPELQEESITLVCEARDNDNREPWVLAVAKADETTVRVPNTNVGSDHQCATVVNDAVALDDRLLLCVTKDNDGRDPWSLATISPSGEILRLEGAVGDYSSCISTLTAAVISEDRTSAVTCMSKDDDARAPYVVVQNVGTETSRVGEASYDSLSGCLAALRH